MAQPVPAASGVRSAGVRVRPDGRVRSSVSFGGRATSSARLPARTAHDSGYADRGYPDRPGRPDDRRYQDYDRYPDRRYQDDRRHPDDGYGYHPSGDRYSDERYYNERRYRDDQTYPDQRRPRERAPYLDEQR